MPTLLRTLDDLPDIGNRRFSSVGIGSRAAGNIREEFSLLRSVAALVCGCVPEAVTREQLVDIEGAVAAWRALLRDDRPAAVEKANQLVMDAVAIEDGVARVQDGVDGPLSEFGKLALMALAFRLGPAK